MCRNFGPMPSQRLRIEHELTAYDLDRTANARLKLYDDERDARMAEILGVGSLVNALGGGSSGVSIDRSGPIALDA